MAGTKKVAEWKDPARQKDYYLVHHDEILASQQAYYERHKEERREYNRRYWAKKKQEKDRKVIETQGAEFAGRVADRVSFSLEGTMMKFKQICIIREYVAKAIMDELHDICGIKEN